MQLRVYPENLLKNIEYYKILQHISKHTQLPDARKKILQTVPVNNKKEIQAQFRFLLEIQQTERLRPAPFPPENIPEILTKLNTQFALLSLEEIMPLLAWLLDFQDWFHKIQKLPLNILKNELNFSEEIHKLLRVLLRFFTEKGKWKPEIQARFDELQRKILALSNRLQALLKKILRRLAKQGLAEPQTPTIRNNRYVIPIPAQYKNYLNGILHDISNSGQTLYIEPSETTELQNEIRRQKFLLQNEIKKVLTELSENLRPLKKLLQEVYELNVFIETVLAKLKWQEETLATIPEIAETFRLKLSRAKNPYLILQKGLSETVPFDLELNSEQRILVISGPNAGGKSITLKAVLLNILLFQSGIPVPVGESSEFFIFQKVFADIGDRQSAEEELSTYSARLSLMNNLLENCNAQSIFFIDELGSGTAPEFGGAIAKAFLEELLTKKCPGIITTHYEILKNMAMEHPEILNAAMEFDAENLSPTYRFLPGEIGRSFALEIAERVGTKPQILKRAKQFIHKDTWQAEQILKEARKKELQLRKILEENDNLREELRKKLEKIKIKEQKIQKEKEQILAKTQREAGKLLHSLAKDLKKNKNLKKASEKIAKELQKMATPQVPRQTPQEGDQVRVKGSNTSGKLQRILGDQAEVLIGNMKFILPLTDLEKANPLPRTPRHSKKNSRIITTASKEIDLRGLQTEEALQKLDKWLNQLILSGVERAEIFHGEGTGALKRAVGQFLREHYDNYFSFKQDKGRTFLRLR